MSESLPLTDWLRAAGRGDNGAAERAYAMVYAELRRLAACQMASADGQATLTPSGLVSEAFIKLAGGSLAALNDRSHFFNLAARAMRQTMIDYARERLAQKRGGDLIRTELGDDLRDQALDAQQALAVNQALIALDQQDTQLAATLSWRAFAGLSTVQIAELRGVTERTVQRDLVLARNYLRLALGDAA